MAALVQLLPDRKRHSLGARTDVGRSPECDVVITDASISRRHCSITFAAGVYTLADLQSKFGSFVNERPAEKPLPLKHGDKVRLGNIVLEFESLGDQTAAAPVEGSTTDERRIAGVRDEVTRGVVSPQRLGELESTLGELERRVAELTRAERKNEVLLEVGRVVNFNFERGMLAEVVIDTILRAMRAERCAILFHEKGMLMPKAVRGLSASLNPERQKLVVQCFQEGSLARMGPDQEGRTSYCVPIRGKKEQALGIIYLDPPVGRQLEKDELDLLLAIAQQVAMSLENLSLLDSIRNEEKKRESLSRYMSDSLVDAIVSGRMDLNLGGAYRQVTVMFVDIRGFTTISEKLEPAEILQMLNEYFSATTHAVFEVEGTIDKYIGDALMAVFGAPVAYDDHAARAVKAAVEIRRVVQLLTHQWVDKPWARALGAGFNVGIGVNTGMAVAGNIGSARRMEYTVIGDAVNLASRLCSNAARGQILIGPETYQAVKGSVPVKPLAPLKVKGKELPVQAYEVIDELF